MSALSPLEKKLLCVLRDVAVLFPELARFAFVDVELSYSVSTATISDKRMTVNPLFFDSLDDTGKVFVVAHELLHLHQRTSSRWIKGWEKRIIRGADGVINDLLRERMSLAKVPARGIDIADGRFLSAEVLALRDRDQNQDQDQDRDQDRSPLSQGTGGQRQLGDDDVVRTDSSDVPEPPRRPTSRPLGPSDIEPRGFSLDGFETVMLVGSSTDDLKRLDSLLAVATFRNRDYFDADTNVVVPPSLYREIDDMQSKVIPHRSWMRPSRRVPPGSPFLRPGRMPETPALRFLIDTSVSMVGLIRQALGVVIRVAERKGMKAVRLIQADRSITRDESFTLSTLRRVFVVGDFSDELFLFNAICENCHTRHAVFSNDSPLGDLRASFGTLAASSDRGPMVVLTDGRVRIPDRSPGFPVVFGVLGDYSMTVPRWAKVVPIKAKP